jgi:Zn-dependent protease
MELGFIFIIAALIISIVIHEASHGYMANWLGDPTARLAGRLTLNPIPHIDPLGSVIIPGLLYLTGAGILFGYAKPVPYNPYNLRNQKWGEALVAAAGPGVNILIAVVFGLIVRFGDVLALDAAFLFIAGYIVYINILLACFNLIPVPPLDGSKILAAFLPLRARMSFEDLGRRIEQYGLIATIVFIFIFINFLWAPFSQVVNSIFMLLTGTSFF